MIALALRWNDESSENSHEVTRRRIRAIQFCLSGSLHHNAFLSSFLSFFFFIFPFFAFSFSSFPSTLRFEFRQKVSNKYSLMHENRQKIYLKCRVYICFNYILYVFSILVYTDIYFVASLFLPFFDGSRASTNSLMPSLLLLSSSLLYLLVKFSSIFILILVYICIHILWHFNCLILSGVENGEKIITLSLYVYVCLYDLLLQWHVAACAKHIAQPMRQGAASSIRKQTEMIEPPQTIAMSCVCRGSHTEKHKHMHMCMVHLMGNR